MPKCLRVASAGGAESVILSAGGAESMMLSACAESMDTLSAGGMVQANVGQKLVKRNKITCFHLCPMLSSGHCSNEYTRNMTTTPRYVILITIPPQTNYILTLVKPFSFV
jgi:hypothetical protein